MTVLPPPTFRFLLLATTSANTIYTLMRSTWAREKWTAFVKNAPTRRK